MNPQELIEQYQKQDFNYWLDKLLSNVSDDMDTREGSIIYDALAPVAAELEEQSLGLAEKIKQLYTQTATGEFLDWKAVERGVSRETATNAQVNATFTNSDGNPLTNVNVNDRFASVGDEPLFYTVTRVNSDGTALLKADLSGTLPNAYTGQIIPVTPNDALSWAEITDVSVPAKENEDDEHLRDRTIGTSNYISYGGNVADYQSMMKTIEDVGATQIYSAWQGGSTVKLVILNNDLKPASNELINQVKNTIDPAETSGLGYGLAPIGHKVTVVTPDIVNVDVASNVTTDGVTPLSVLHNSINIAIANYFTQQRSKWDRLSSINKHSYELKIYRSQILSAILAIEHVTDATMPTLNGNENDIELVFNSETSQLPVLRDVILNG